MSGLLTGHSKVKALVDNIDTVAGLAGLIAGVIITLLFLISQTIYFLMLGPALLSASLTYLVLKTWTGTLDQFNLGTGKKILDVVFFVFFTLSIWVLFGSADARPFLYFITISATSGFLAISILFVGSKVDQLLQIFKIIILSFNLIYSKFYFFSGSGVDYWYHLKANAALVMDGFIGVLPDKEFSFPLMHIQVAIHQLMENIPIKDASNFAIIVPLVISSICVFLIARKFFDARIGLMALLFVNISDYFLLWGATPQTTTFGLCLYYFIFFVLIRGVAIQKTSLYWMIVILILFASIVVSNAISSFI